jgi:hypothetical protein
VHLAVATNRAEQWPGIGARLLKPRLDRPHRARLRIRAIRDSDLSARAVLIGLASAQSDRETVLAERAIRDVQAYELRPPKRPREPSRISARSRAPIRPASAASTIARISSVSVGALGADAVPSVRRMPLSVFRTMPADVGEFSPVALCASAIAFKRRWIVPTLSRPAHSAI